jgi:hypothetical protein
MKGNIALVIGGMVTQHGVWYVGALKRAVAVGSAISTERAMRKLLLAEV